MQNFWLILIVLSVLYSIGSGLAIFLSRLFFFFILPVVVAVMIYIAVKWIYYLLNPDKKKAKLHLAAKKAEAERLLKESKAETAKRIKKELEAKKKKEELRRHRHRDADQQETPYTYQIGKHGNESLAIRYGIANQEKKVKEGWYYASGGEKKRNPARDRIYYAPANTIRLQKKEKLSKDLYKVLLADFGDHEAKAIIEVGTEYVKTFYPLDEGWFVRHAGLEKTLKNSNTFTLKELATFHVQKTVDV